jgi:UPF0755 protein
MKYFSQMLYALFEHVHRQVDSFEALWRYRTNLRTSLFALLFGSFSAWMYFTQYTPPAQFPVHTLISVDKGASAQSIADDLVQQHVIRSAWAFRGIVYMYGATASLHAGDYSFKQPVGVWTIARAVMAGAYGLEPIHITIPEGTTVEDMAEMYARVLPRFDKKSFLIQATPHQGFLFPDTYYFLPNVHEDTVIKTMQANFDQRIASHPEIFAHTTHSMRDIVIMASIVEKEANKDYDRRMIAGVLWNRISKGIPLQSDVPIIYVTGKADSKLTLTDLKNDSPYNTYVHKGLPIGAVNNPSFSALAAAANPIKNDYLFYLADSNDTTYYARTYAEHLKFKAQYIDHATSTQ